MSGRGDVSLFSVLFWGGGGSPFDSVGSWLMGMCSGGCSV